MAGETPITVVGNLTADPELRFTPSGAAVANFTVASTPRTFDRQTNEWKDGEALFLNCSVWRQAAENAAESLTRGMRVAWRFEPNEGGWHVSIEHQLDLAWPLIGGFAARRVIGPQFVEAIARRTLGRVKELAEAPA